MTAKKGKEGKGRESTKSNAIVYFTYSWGSPPWTDFHQILHIGRYAGRNHLCKFWFGKIKGFEINGGVTFWNGWSPLQLCCATVQPVTTNTYDVDSLSQNASYEELCVIAQIQDGEDAWRLTSLDVVFFVFCPYRQLTLLPWPTDTDRRRQMERYTDRQTNTDRWTERHIDAQTDKD